MSLRHIVLIGPQGSGKGTQASLLSKKFKLPVVRVGAIYRDHIKRKTSLGKKSSKIINQGGLMPDKFTNDLVKEELKKIKYKKGAIFDGYPRRIGQANFLDKLVLVDKVILIDITQQETISRLKKRRQCEKCKEIYHLTHKPPKKGGICDLCGGKLVIRQDDYPQAIKKRLSIYKKEINPILQKYNKESKLIKINGKGDIKIVFNQIIEKLKEIK